MYRRALAASWAAQPGELGADKCIEDIFAGGDGWGGQAKVVTPRIAHEDDSEEDRLHKHNRNSSNSSLKSESTIKGGSRLGHKQSRSRDLGGHNMGTQSPGGQTSSDSERGRTGSGFRKAHEVDEFDIREDLVAWRLPGKVTVS